MTLQKINNRYTTCHTHGWFCIYDIVEDDVFLNLHKGSGKVPTDIIENANFTVSCPNLCYSTTKVSK